LIELDRVPRLLDDHQPGARDQLVQPMSTVDRLVRGLDLIREELVGFSDLPVERSLPRVVEPRESQRVQGVWPQSPVARPADIGPHHTLMNGRRERGEHVSVIAYQTEEVRTPRSERDHVDQCQRREPASMQQMAPQTTAPP
jgi:hypothetical protein